MPHAAETTALASAQVMPAVRAPVNRAVALGAGIFLALAFFGLQLVPPGIRITFHPPLNASSPGEIYFWLGHALLLFPASCLLGYACAPLIGPQLARFGSAIENLSRRERTLGFIALFMVAIAVARIGHFAVLGDFPFTDDEYAAQYGGYIMASGHARTALVLPKAAISTLGLHIKDGYISTADWPGGQAIWAIAELTRLGPLVWALLAAVPVVALMLLMCQRLNAVWGVGAALILFCSPMALMLSMTSHAFLGSRAMLAVALTGYWFAEQRRSFRLWALTGLALGLGFLFRPLEILFFSAPLLGWAAIQSMRKAPGYSRALLALLIGGLVPILLMLLHAYSVTGNPFVPPRFENPDAAGVDIVANSLWDRFGANMSYNLFMLAIWFLGPLGIILIVAGVMTDGFTRLLAVGVATELSLALFHTNVGLHAVGPIHYSDSVVPLTIIAVHGFANILQWARRHQFDQSAIASAALMTLVVGLGIFNLTHGSALQSQASIQTAVYSWIDQSVHDSDGRKAVVLAPQFGATWAHIPGMAPVGTWVFEWRRPTIGLSDDSLILHDKAGVEEWVRATFPDRRIYRLVVLAGPPHVALIPLSGGPIVPWR